jgi:hypothetical protein
MDRTAFTAPDQPPRGRIGLAEELAIQVRDREEDSRNDKTKESAEIFHHVRSLIEGLEERYRLQYYITFLQKHKRPGQRAVAVAAVDVAD